jgi:hypothetical protein
MEDVADHPAIVYALIAGPISRQAVFDYHPLCVCQPEQMESHGFMPVAE